MTTTLAYTFLCVSVWWEFLWEFCWKLWTFLLKNVYRKKFTFSFRGLWICVDICGFYIKNPWMMYICKKIWWWLNLLGWNITHVWERQRETEAKSREKLTHILRDRHGETEIERQGEVDVEWHREGLANQERGRERLSDREIGRIWTRDRHRDRFLGRRTDKPEVGQVRGREFASLWAPRGAPDQGRASSSPQATKGADD